MDCRSEYLTTVLMPKERNEAIMLAVQYLQGVQFDAIACCGNSGTLFAGALGLRMNKPIILVRKTVEGTHSTMLIEGPCPPEAMSYIIVDDFRITGRTMLYIVEQLHKSSVWKDARFVGMYTYQYPLYATYTELTNRLCGYGGELKKIVEGEVVKEKITDKAGETPPWPPPPTPSTPPPTQWFRYATNGKIEEVK